MATSTLSVEPLPAPILTIKTVEQTSTVKEEYNVYASCITTLRLFAPDAPLKDAKDYVANSVPRGGGAVLFYYPDNDIYHVAYIQQLLEDTIYIKEGNFKKGEYTERYISYDDPRIIGYWYNDS